MPTSKDSSTRIRVRDKKKDRITTFIAARKSNDLHFFPQKSAFLFSAGDLFTSLLMY